MRGGAAPTGKITKRPDVAGTAEDNRCISSEALGINIHSHRAMEQVLRGFNQAYNARRQRELDGRTPNRVAAERLNAEPKLANPASHGRAGPCDTTKARLIAEAAKEVSQPNMLAPSRGHWAVENNLHWVLDVTMGEEASLLRRGHGPRNRATLKRVALNTVRIVTGKNSMRDAVLDVRVLADILDHMPLLDAKSLSGTRPRVGLEQTEQCRRNGPPAPGRTLPGAGQTKTA